MAGRGGRARQVPLLGSGRGWDRGPQVWEPAGERVLLMGCVKVAVGCCLGTGAHQEPRLSTCDRGPGPWRRALW